MKTINFRDRRSRNYQKNLTNRRSDLLIEAVTLHRRFPYSVLLGILFLDAEAASDETSRRRSTFENSHERLRLFTGRDDPSGRDEQYERLYVALVDANPFSPSCRFFLAGTPEKQLALEDILDDVIELLAERNFDFYEAHDGVLRVRQ